MNIFENQQQNRTLNDAGTNGKIITAESPNNVDIERMPEIQKLKVGVEKVLQKLKNNIEKNKYDTIIAEGDSARVITLLLGKAIQKIQKKEGKNVSKILFIDPDYAPRNEEYSNKMKKIIQNDNTSNVLVVTEEISSGWEMTKLFIFLKSSGVNSIDIAVDTISKSYSGNEEVFRNVLAEKVEVFNKDYPERATVSGEEVAPTLGTFFSIDSHSGNLLGHNIKLNAVDNLGAHRGSPETTKYVNRIRKDIELTATELAEDYIRTLEKEI